MTKRFEHNPLGEQIIWLHKDQGMRKVDIAEKLGISRQLVGYHLGQKLKRRRTHIGKREKSRLQALARGRYAKQKLLESGML